MDLLPHEARRRTKVGTVVSDKMDKTVVVSVESLKRHSLYGRSMRRTKKYHAHDEENRCKVGDKVVIAESRPLSRTKRWRVREVIGHDVVLSLPKVKDPDVSGAQRSDVGASPAQAESAPEQPPTVQSSVADDTDEGE